MIRKSSQRAIAFGVRFESGDYRDQGNTKVIAFSKQGSCRQISRWLSGVEASSKRSQNPSSHHLAARFDSAQGNALNELDPVSDRNLFGSLFKGKSLG